MRAIHGSNHEIGDDVTQIDDIRHRYADATPLMVPFPSPAGDDMVEEPAPLSDGTAGLALVMSLLWLMGAGALLGVALGIVAARRCRRTGAPGRGMALAAVVLGLVGLVLSPPVLALL